MAAAFLKKILHLPPFKAGIFTTCLCCLIYFLVTLSLPTLTTALDDKIVDMMYRIRGPQPSSGSVVIVDIDDTSLQQFGQWPWPRKLMTELTEQILASDPSSLGFTIMFAEKDRSSPSAFIEGIEDILTGQMGEMPFVLSSVLAAIPNYDSIFGETLNDPRCVQGFRLLFQEDFRKQHTASPKSDTALQISPPYIPPDAVQLISGYRTILNTPNIRKGGREGFLNLFPAQAGLLRKAPLLALIDGKMYPSLALQMYRTSLDNKVVTLQLRGSTRDRYYPVAGVRVGDHFISTDESAQLAINFRGPYTTFLSIPAADVLTGSGTRFLRDKHILIGSTAAEMIDVVTTPFSSRMPGVAVQANTLDNLIMHDGFVIDRTRDKTLAMILILAGGIITSGLLSYLHPVAGVFSSLLISVLICAAHYYQFAVHQQLMNLTSVYVCLAAVFIVVALSSYLFERNKRLFIKQAFSQYLSPDVIGELMKSPEKLNLLVDTREVTILFCDIRDFTSLAEGTTPEELSVFLNRYFSLFSDIIIKHRGMLDKYIGDAIMAVWGTPLRDMQHASGAVEAALEMVEAMEKHQPPLTLAGKRVEIGIGINTGVVSAGNFGCSRRFDYTVLGDNVNLASRVESVTKYYPLEILITDATRRSVEPSVTCRFIDSVLVKGRTTPVDLFQPLHAEKAERLDKAEYSSYLDAIQLYRAGNFKAAGDLFLKLCSTHEDPLYEIYLKRCSHFLDVPPGENWSGVFTHR